MSAGTVADVPADLRGHVAEGSLARRYVTIWPQGVEIPTLIIGQPVRTAGRDLEFYLLFPLDAEQRTLSLVQSTLIVGGLVLLLLLAGIASLVTRQVVRPVRQAAEIAERFADGHLDERMPVHGNDEVARLAESYNEMAGSIQTQIRQLEEFGALQRRFTSDVSHELRTPLTTVRMAADVLHASKDQLLPALRRSSELLVTELDRFEALLADLLEISRLDAGVADLTADRVDVHGVVTRAVEAVRGFAEESGTPLRLHLPTGVHAEVDPRRVERIVRNLVANAVDHGEGRPVDITLAGDERRGGRGGARSRGRAAAGRGGAGVQPVLARRGVAGPPQRGQRARSVDQHRGRPPARRLAAGVGRARARVRVPAHAAARRRRPMRRARCRSCRTTAPRMRGGCRAGAAVVDLGVAAGSVPTPVHGMPVIRAALRGPPSCRTGRSR